MLQKCVNSDGITLFFFIYVVFYANIKESEFFEKLNE